MVMDIAKSLIKQVTIDVFASNTRGGTFSYEGVGFLKRSYGLFIKYLYSCISLKVILKLRKDYKMSNATLLRLFYCWMTTGLLKHIIEKGHYDVVHIHGCGFITELWIRVCQKCNQKYAVTLHGLNSYSETVAMEPAGKQYERDFLKRVAEGNIHITVISTGMKRIIEDTFNVSNCNNISVICNSFNFEHFTNNIIDIKDEYHIPKESKIILCIGNICKRKNQEQIIRAFDYMEEGTASHLYVLFLGATPDPEYSIEKFTENSKYKDHFINCGVVEKAQVGCYYEQGDAVALLSLSEGFGLSLIEGMHFGLPCISFADIDAFEDLYSPDAMVGIKQHSDRAVANGFEILINKNWNKSKIIDCSKKFDPEIIAEKYVLFYDALIKS